MNDNYHLNRPPRTWPQELELALILEKTRYRQFILSHPQHESLEHEPRPLPPITLSDLCAMKNDSLDENRLSNGVLWFAFYSNRVAHEENASIPISPDDLLWLCSPEDIVLLSDFRADHYSRIDRIVDKRIYLLDPWPDLMPIKSVHYDEGLLFIEQEAFLEDAVGLLTLDTPQLVDSFFEHRPDLINDYEIIFAFGNCILLRNSPRLSWYAARLLGKAVYLAHKGNSSRFPVMVSRNYLALVEAEANKDQSPFPDYLQGKLTNLLRNWKLDSIEECMDSSALLRAARALISIDALEIARHHIEFVNSIEPSNDEALLVRASLNIIEGNTQEAHRDADAGLKANQEISIRMNEEISSLKEKDISNRERLERRLRKISIRREKLMEILEIN
jgi:hypothetical protein